MDSRLDSRLDSWLDSGLDWSCFPLDFPKLPGGGRRKRKEQDNFAKGVVDVKQAQDLEIATLKKIVFAVMPEAINRASGNGKYPFSARGLYYQIRPLIQRYTDRELSYEYFTPPILTEYQDLYGPIPGLYYEPRGLLIEPHTGKEIPLGTREVAAYEPEPWTFDKVLYVEKTGLLPILRAGRIAEKYDMALMSSQGFANRSAKDLLADFEREFDKVTILCLHDCDISGHEIARTLAEETRTSKHTINVIDIGLSVEDVEEWNLQTETVHIRQTPPAEFLKRLSRLERRFFLGRKASAKNGVLKGRRCELNAFRPDDLIKFIELKLQSLGLGAKLIPPKEVLQQAHQKQFTEHLQEEIRAEVIKRLNVDAIVATIASNMQYQQPSAIQLSDIGGEPGWREIIDQKAIEQVVELLAANSGIIDNALLTLRGERY